MFSHYAVLAHQGGWDEMLYAAVPLVIMALLLRKANRRANHNLKNAVSDETTQANPEAESD